MRSAQSKSQIRFAAAALAIAMAGCNATSKSDTHQPAPDESVDQTQNGTPQKTTLIIVEDGERQGVIDNLGNIVVPLGGEGIDHIFSLKNGLTNNEEIAPPSENAKDIHDELVIISRNELFGYADREGNEVIAPQFASGTRFYDGRAVVRLTPEYVEELCGRRDCGCKDEHADAPPKRSADVLAACVQSKKDGEPNAKYALIDARGHVLSRFDYNEIDRAHSPIRVRREGFVGFIDEQGKELFNRGKRTGAPNEAVVDHRTLTYCFSRVATNETTDVIHWTACYPSTMGYIDDDHQFVHGLELASDVMAGTFVWRFDTDLKGYGLIDEQKNWMTAYRLRVKPQRSHAGLSVFQLYKTGARFGWINAEGRIIWPPNWSEPCDDTGGTVIWPEGAC